ncbi:MAG: uracil-DNA glycosylase [Thermodesulforhabdaceae bacterium]
MRTNNMGPTLSWEEENILRWCEMLCKYWEFCGVETLPRVCSSFDQADNRKEQLEELERSIDGCTKCRLSEGRTHIVFGDGNPEAKLVFVGEGPGHEEDVQGLPFVGQAGRLLTKMIHAIGLSRKDVYICNVVKCRPPQNRTPMADEIAACSPFLFKQLEIIKPRIICALGACAVEALLRTKQPMNRIRGRIFNWQGIPVVPTFHPAYLLRNAIEKRKAWEDFLIVRKYLDSEGV